MKHLLPVVLLLVAATTAVAQPPAEMPKPVKEHEWLAQLVGEWKTEGRAVMPDQSELKCEGTESTRSLGGFWNVSENKGTMPGTDKSVSAIMTLGYDPAKKKYVGTWADSVSSHMWHYEGTLDSTGKILTLDTEGPDFFDPAKKAKYRDTIEIKSKDHKTLSSSVLGPDGKWTTFMTSHAHRVK